MFARVYLSSWCVLASLCLVRCQQDVGDACTIESSGGAGQCMFLENCDVAIQELLQKRKRPQLCGFVGVGTQPLVCCPQTTQATTTTTTSTTTRKPSIPSRFEGRVGERSKQKCKEYGKYVYVKEKPPVLVGDDVEEVDVNECGIIEVPLIVGGEPAKPKEFPHMALLGYGPDKNIKWQCAGTLISDQFVMTAGHCLYHREYAEVKHVRLGDLNINTDIEDARPQQLKVQQIIKHPDYRYPSHYNDIALLKLTTRADLNPYARPACLHRQPEVPTKRAIATGWGKTQYAGTGSDSLQKVVLEMFTTESCNSSYSRQIGTKLSRGIVEESQVCAGSHTEEKDTCQGDSGGPLQIYSNETYCMYEVVGVTSFGKACGIVNTPGVYTRVYHYLKWIEDTVWP